MKNIYLITDTHFNHRKMETFCGRPANFEDTILFNLLAIPAGAVLVHLCDFCIGRDNYWHEQFMKHTAHLSLKILVKGNHDNKSDLWYKHHGWDVVTNSMNVTVDQKRYILTHIPVKPEGYYAGNIHGHFHNSDHRKDVTTRSFYKKGEYHHLLAIEYTQLSPVALTAFLQGKK